MSWGKTILSVSILGVTIAGFTTFKTVHRMHKFYYYPDLNVYYNVHEQKFIYSIDGGQSWSVMNWENNEASALGKKIVLTSDQAEIWQQNKQHLSKHGGYLVNLIETMQKQTAKSEPPKKKKEESKKLQVEVNGERIDPSHWDRQYLLDAVENVLAEVVSEVAEKSESLIKDKLVEDTTTQNPDSTRFW